MLLEGVPEVADVVSEILGGGYFLSAVDEEASVLEDSVHVDVPGVSWSDEVSDDSVSELDGLG